MKNLYPEEKLCSAVDCLAISSASIQDRLENALEPMIGLKESDFESVDAKALFNEIFETVTAVKDGPKEKGHIRSTLDKMSDSDAVELSSLILQLYHRVRTD